MRIRTVAALAALAAMAFLPATAQAEKKPDHCVLDLSANATMSCFATFTEVVAAVTGGRITTAPEDPRKAMDDPAFVARLNEKAAAANEYILSIHYEHIHFEGSTLTAVGPHPCNLLVGEDPPEYWLPSMPAGWDNRISSFKAGNYTSGGCRVSNYVDPDFHGSSTSYRDIWGDMRNMCTAGCTYPFNDLTSSIKWD